MCSLPSVTAVHSAPGSGRRYTTAGRHPSTRHAHPPLWNADSLLSLQESWWGTVYKEGNMGTYERFAGSYCKYKTPSQSMLQSLVQFPYNVRVNILRSLLYHNTEWSFRDKRVIVFTYGKALKRNFTMSPFISAAHSSSLYRWAYGETA